MAFLRGVSRPSLTPYEKTAAAAREIVESSASKRIEQTAALRAARLARDAAAEPAPAPTGKGKAKA